MNRSTTAAVRLLSGYKEPVRIASTANLALSGLSTIDGVAAASGDRILVKNQTDASQNGIYTASEGRWYRAPDSNSARTLQHGMKVFVQEGTQANQEWIIFSDEPDLGSDDVDFSLYLSTDIVGIATTAAATAAAASTAASAAASAAAASAVAAANSTPTYASRAALAAASVPQAVLSTQVFGYATPGDCDAFRLKRVTSQPLYGGVRSVDRYLPNGTIDSTNGGWWVYVPGAAGVDACAFGVKADWDNTRTQLASGGGDTGATDCRLLLQNAMNFASMQTFPGFDSGGGAGNIVLLPKGTMMFTSTLVIPDGVILKGTGVYSTVLKLSSSFPNNSHAVIVGTSQDSSSVCASQTRASAGALSLTGNSVVDGVAQLLTKRVISVYSTGNNSGISFTITGTDGDGNAQTETKAGPNFGSVDYSYYNTVTSVTVNGAITGNVSVGNTVVASFGARAEELQMWSNHTQAQAGKAIFYSNNAQHTGGLCKLKIFSGNRSAVWFETGVGGASCFTMEDIECGNYGNASGVASNNPCMYFNYAGLLSTLRRIVVEGNSSIGSASIGIQVDGGLMHISDTHVESYGTGILTNVRNINNGLVTISQFIGSGGIMSSCIRMDAASTTTPHLLVQGIMTNGSPSALNDGRPGGTSTPGNILAWTQK